MTVPVTLPDSAAFDLASDEGARYRIMVAWPPEPAPPEGFPVIYLLDGHAFFGALVDSLRSRADRPAATGVAPAIVVGIAHTVDGGVDQARRTLDYTPALPTEELPPRQDGRPWPPHGGDQAFAHFLLVTLRERIAAAYPVDHARSMLFAHSLAGLFAVSTLCRTPEAFRSWIIVSPSLWWIGNRIDGMVDGLVCNADVPATRIQLAAGEYEERLAPWQMDAPDAERTAVRRAERRMVAGTRALAERLAASAPLQVSFTEYAGEDHASVVLRVMNDALRPGVSRR